VNAEQAPKTGIAEADLPPRRGRPQSSQTGEQPESGNVGFYPRGRFCRGKGDGTPQEAKHANTGDPGQRPCKVNEMPARDRLGWPGSRRGP